MFHLRGEKSQLSALSPTSVLELFWSAAQRNQLSMGREYKDAPKEPLVAQYSCRNTPTSVLLIPPGPGSFGGSEDPLPQPQGRAEQCRGVVLPPARTASWSYPHFSWANKSRRLETCPAWASSPWQDITLFLWQNIRVW